MPLSIYPASTGGASTFLALTDTFSSYSGNSLKAIRVNTGETALETYVPGTLSDGDKTDVTVSSSGSVWTVNSGLDATKIGGGDVTSTEFDYLNGVTSAIQTQLNSKQATITDSDDIAEGSTNLFFTTAERSKLSGIEASADVTDATNVDAAGAVMNSDTTTATMSFVIDEDNMASDSATKVPTQQSVKAYVDANAGGGSGHTADATLTQATSAYNIDGKDVRITLSSGTTGSINTFIDMATVGKEGHIVEIKNSTGGNYTITTTSLSNFIGGSYVIPNGGVAEFFVRRNLLTTAFNQTTHIHVGNAGAYS